MNETVHDVGALRALREVGRQGSIAAASSVLGVSQQALSARMRTLERATGVTLLARTPSGSHLTEQGRLVVGWAEDVLDTADRLEAGLRSISSGVSHRLAIAASQTIAEHLVPHWLVELRSVERAGAEQQSAEQAAGYPPTVVELTVANSTGCSTWSARGRPGSASSRPRTCRRTWPPSTSATTNCSWSPRRATRGRDAAGRCHSPRSPQCRWSCGRPA